MNIFDMSDEDFIKSGGTPDTGATDPLVEEDDPLVEADEPETPVEDDTSTAEENQPVVSGSTEGEDDAADPKLDDKPVVETETDAEKPQDQKPESKGDQPAEADKAKPVETPVDYEAEYKKLLAPFKANGREITLSNTDEVIKLMQMGANYAKKMQAIQPNLRILKMLENNQLLDEEKINYLIDLNKGDKGALHKALKDTNTDPMDFDTTQDVAYKPKNHKVSDKAIQFQSVLDELKESDYGMAIIVEAHNKFDAASQDIIYEEPEVLQALSMHKQRGYYDRIAAEVERRKLLGDPHVTKLPFIHAYKLVGDAMQEAGEFTEPGNQTGQSASPVAQSKSTPVAVAQPAPAKTVTNSTRAKAASPSAKNTARTVKIDQNPLLMADEDFLKAMNGRF